MEEVRKLAQNLPIGDKHTFSVKTRERLKIGKLEFPVMYVVIKRG